MYNNAHIEDGGRIISIHIPMKFKRRGGRKQIILPDGKQTQSGELTPLQLAIVRAFQWQKELENSESVSISELAKEYEVDKSFVAKHLRLTLLAPDIINAILDGNEPAGITIPKLFKAIPLLWEEQHQLYHF